MKSPIEDYDGVAGIYLRGTDSNPSINWNAGLVSALGRRGLATILIPGRSGLLGDDGEGNDTLRGLVVEAPERLTGPEFQASRYIELPIGGEDGLRVVRSRMPVPRFLDQLVPVVNGAKLRKVGASKWAQVELFPQYSPGTVILEDGQPFDPAQIDELAGDRIVVKEDMSSGTVPPIVASRLDTGAAILRMRDMFVSGYINRDKPRANKNIVLQEYIEGNRWPALRGSDKLSNDALANTASTELRVSCFVDADRRVTPIDRFHAVARVFDGRGGDEWTFVDQDTVPQVAWDTASSICKELLRVTGSVGGYIAVDLINGVRPGGSGDEEIVLREINTRTTQMVLPAESRHVAELQRRRLANLMAALAKT